MIGRTSEHGLDPFDQPSRRFIVGSIVATFQGLQFGRGGDGGVASHFIPLRSHLSILTGGHAQRGAVRGQLPRLFSGIAVGTAIVDGEIGDLVLQGGDLVLEGGDAGVSFAEEGFGAFVREGDRVGGGAAVAAGGVEGKEGHDDVVRDEKW